MKILVTGAKGFVGRNLCENLKNLRDGKNRTRPALTVDEIYEYDIDTDPVLLEEYCAKANFVFNLAGVNRPKNEAEFMQGNFGFASTLLDMLKRHGNTCPVMLSSSIQATLIGRYGQSDYGKACCYRKHDSTAGAALPRGCRRSRHARSFHLAAR